MEHMDILSDNELMDLCGISNSDAMIDSQVVEPATGGVSDPDVIIVSQCAEPSTGGNVSNGTDSDIPKDLDCDGAPFKDMQFASLDAALEFYKDYGAKNGFNVRKRSTDVSGQREQAHRVVKICCSCEGDHKVKKDDVTKRRHTSHDRKKCPARMIVHESIDKSYWYVTTFIKEHSHALLTPSKKVLLRSQKCLPQPAKSLLKSFDAEGVRLNTVVRLFGETTTLGFDERDCYNHMRKARQYNEVGDAQSVKDYLKKMMLKDPQSYHAIQQDDDGRAINFFWIDGRSRNAYTIFGDVVSFDTTYRTNKYSMPFAPFTGVNHYGQSILFGCALLENETEETFVWLFENWLQAMGMKAPTSMITDQDRAMGRAIARVMPDTYHRYCLWHIKQKFPEKFGNIYFKKLGFKTMLDECIHRTYTVEEFEAKWSSFVVDYEVKDNEWLSELYRIRERWVPVYSQQTFFAGMMTSQRSESMNQFFNGFVTPKTTLYEFVKNYRKAVTKRYEEERKQDVISMRERITTSRHHLLEDASKVYTATMYNKFAEQFERVCRLRVDQFDKSGDEVSFRVRKIKDAKFEFVVKMNFEMMEGSCSCHLFEFLGIPCRHVLAVLERNYLTEIPKYFILQRWKKDAAISLSPPVCLSHGASHNVSEAVIASDFCKRFSQLSHMAARTEEGRKLVEEVINSTYHGLREIELRLLMEDNDPEKHNTKNIVVETTEEDMTEQTQVDMDDNTLLDPRVSQTKGRTRCSQQQGLSQQSTNKRIKSGIELSQETKKKQVRRCKICNLQGHYQTTCPSMQQ